MTPQEQSNITKTGDSFWGFFVNNWRVTLLSLIIFVFGGVAALISMPLESDPEVEIPIAIVTTIYPGAASTDVEKLMTDRLEEKLQNLDNLKRLESSSSEGVSSIVVRFEASADVKESIGNLRDEVDSVKSDLPEDAKDPIVTEVRIGDFPIITVSLLADLPPTEMKKFGEDLQDLLESISGVSNVSISGLEREKMQVFVDIKKLEGYGMSLSQIISAIAANHIDLPIGSILTNGFYYQTSVQGQFDSAEELLNLPIASRGKQNIFLRDVAIVREAFAEISSKSRVFRTEEENYRDSVTLQVFKKTGANITKISDTVRENTMRYAAKNFPPAVEVLVTNDNSEFIRDDIRTLGINAIQTIAIIFILLLLALGIKEAILVGFSIPFIFLITFIFLRLVGETLNGLVLFSLILSLGLMVDSSIVIMEGIHESIKHRKTTSREAALLAIHTYKAPLISGTLTTISAFIPMALMSGLMGDFIKHIPLTVTITLLVSFFVAVFILSAVAARIFQKQKLHEARRKPLLNYLIDPLKIWYLTKIRRILSSKIQRRVWVTGMMIAFFAAISLPIFGILKVQMFPSFNADYFNVSIELPTGATFVETDRITAEVEEMIEDLPEVKNFVSIVGGGAVGLTGLFNFSNADRANRASITVNITKKDDRELKSQDLAEILRKKVASITDADIKIEELQAGPPSGAPIEVRLLGDDLGLLENFSKIVVYELKEIEGARDVDTDITHGTGEFHFKMKRDHLNFYGISAAQFASELRTAVFGNDSVKILRNGEEIPIVVALDFRNEECKNNQMTRLLETRNHTTLCLNNPHNVSQLQNLLIMTPSGAVPVSELAEISLHPAVTTIRHRDNETVVNVRAYPRENVLVSDVMAELQQRLKSIEIPQGIQIYFGGETEEVEESFRSLFNAMSVGVFLIALILVLQFNSYRQPFIIIFTLPLALIGVIIGLALLGRNFSFPGFIGIVSLSGIVVNDAIVFIDRINHHVKLNISKIDAIVKAGSERLQPIILTTITTAAGMLPLALTNELWGDLAWTVALGIVFSSILTLVMVPIFYNALETEKEIKQVN